MSEGCRRASRPVIECSMAEEGGQVGGGVWA